MRIERRAGTWTLALGGWATIWLLGLAASARAQDPPPDSAPPPGLIAPPAWPSSPSTMGATVATPRPGWNPRPIPTSVLDIALASAFGSPTSPWRPLSLRTLFTEGWDEVWAAQPDDSGDALQGWIDAADGSLYRLAFFSYNDTNRLARGGDGNTGAYTIYTPLNRRLEVITTIPFVTSQPTLNVGRQVFPGQTPMTSPHGHRTATGFGDLTVTPRVSLFENDYYSAIAQTSIQIPTGYRRIEAGQAILSPGLQFWANFAEGWVLRGGFGANVGTNRQAGGTILLSQLALGRVFTPHDRPLFGDFTIYLSGNVFNRVSASQTTVTLTPGFRTHLGQEWYFLGGIEVPVTGPRPYEEGFTLWLMKVF